nr:hypothetical protein [Tanacetum cinerariifolium]
SCSSRIFNIPLRTTDLRVLQIGNHSQDTEEDLKEYEEDEAEDGPVDYPMDGGDDGDDDDDGNSLGYDADDEDEDNEDEEEEEEHLAPTDSATSISLPPEAEVERLLAMPTPPPSPLTLLSPPSAGERLARCMAPAAELGEVCHMHSVKCCFDLVEWSNLDLRSRGLCDDLGSAQEEGDGQFVANENEKIDKYISGLPDNIYGNVKSSKPRTLDETIELTNEFMDQKLRTYEKRGDNKKKTDDTSRNNHGHQQQPFKNQNVAKVYNIGTGERKPYEGSFPKCTKCQRHHNGLCTQKCHKCSKVGHFARDCRSSRNANVINNQRYSKETPKGNDCFECEAPRHFKRDYPKLKNKNGGNRNAQGWVYVVGNAEKNGNAPMNPDSNVVTGTFLLNNRYASILFDTGADRSFISIAFSSLVNIDPTPLGSSYDVKLDDGKIVGINTIIRGCTINFQNHPFNIDLMAVELGSFNIIIGMDWLRRCHAVIVCDEKLVQIPYGNETLTFRGNESDNGRESRLAVISCSKAQEGTSSVKQANLYHKDGLCN